jgi:Abnormal spindle-like microcephaly-assoc'd, ASPM-SPD-2-Hydin
MGRFMSRYFLAVILIAASLLSACGGGTVTAKTANGIAAALSASPSTIGFGNVIVGGSSSLTGTLSAGTSPLTVSSASWNGQGYSVSGINFPVTLTAGQSVPYTVTFSPQVSGPVSGSISFISDATNSPTGQTLTGAGTQSSGHSVDLSWDPSASAVVGYNIYRGTTSGGPYPTKLNSTPQLGTSFVDNTVNPTTTYYYVATSLDANSLESSFSNQLKMVIP